MSRASIQGVVSDLSRCSCAKRCAGDVSDYQVGGFPTAQATRDPGARQEPPDAANRPRRAAAPIPDYSPDHPSQPGVIHEVAHFRLVRLLRRQVHLRHEMLVAGALGARERESRAREKLDDQLVKLGIQFG